MRFTATRTPRYSLSKTYYDVYITIGSSINSSGSGVTRTHVHSKRRIRIKGGEERHARDPKKLGHAGGGGKRESLRESESVGVHECKRERESAHHTQQQEKASHH
jgi:hypothetical protein